MPRRTIAIADYRIAFHRTAAISHHGIAFVIQMPRLLEIQMTRLDYARFSTLDYERGARLLEVRLMETRHLHNTKNRYTHMEYKPSTST